MECGGFGDEQNILYCGDCGDAYHIYCFSPSLHALVTSLRNQPAPSISPSISPSPSSPSPSPSLSLSSLLCGWRCGECLLCGVCDETGKEDMLLVCERCERGIHRKKISLSLSLSLSLLDLPKFLIFFSRYRCLPLIFLYFALVTNILPSSYLAISQ